MCIQASGYHIIDRKGHKGGTPSEALDANPTWQAAPMKVTVQGQSATVECVCNNDVGSLLRLCPLARLCQLVLGYFCIFHSLCVLFPQIGSQRTIAATEQEYKIGGGNEEEEGMSRRRECASTNDNE